MSIELVSSILGAALRYPSGDNCQPFRFIIQKDHLEIHFNPESAKHEFDYYKMATCVSLGCLLKAIEIAAAHLGLTTVEKPENLVDRPQIWYTVFFSPSAVAAKNADLFEQLDQRCTSRGTFNSTPRPDLLITQLKNQNQVYILEKYTDVFIKNFQTVDALYWLNTSAVRDLFQAVHFSQKSYHQLRTGIFWKELGIRFYEAPCSFLIKKIPGVTKILYYPFFRFIFNGILKRNILSSSFLVCVTSNCEVAKNREDFLRDQVNIGKRMMEIWLKCTKEGLLVQPLSIVPFLGNLLYFDHDIAFINQPKNKKTLQHSNEEIRSAFGIPNNQKMGWIMRVGNPPLSVLSPYRSLRLRLNQVVNETSLRKLSKGNIKDL